STASTRPAQPIGWMRFRFPCGRLSHPPCQPTKLSSIRLHRVWIELKIEETASGFEGRAIAMPESNHPNADVRMRGFVARSTVKDAVAWIDAAIPAMGDLPTEEVPLPEAAGRVLAADVASAVDVPAFARAMMDGLA